MLSQPYYASYASEIIVNKDDKLCKAIHEEYAKSIKSCVRTLSQCINEGLINIEELVLIGPELISTNRYGYTTILKIDINDDIAVLNLDRFNGDNHWRLLETWLVKLDDLHKVLAAPSNRILAVPLDPTESTKNTRDLNATIFADMLNHSKKIADQNIDFYEWNNRILYLENDFETSFSYGGYQYERLVNRVLVKEIKSIDDIDELCNITFAKSDQQGNPPKENARLQMKETAK